MFISPDEKKANAYMYTRLVRLVFTYGTSLNTGWAGIWNHCWNG